jgi:hypothetical protein
LFVFIPNGNLICFQRIVYIVKVRINVEMERIKRSDDNS